MKRRCKPEREAYRTEIARRPGAARVSSEPLRLSGGLPFLLRIRRSTRRKNTAPGLSAAEYTPKTRAREQKYCYAKAMRSVLSRRTPSLERLLVVESGSRTVTQKFLGVIYPVTAAVDILTCHPGPPPGFDPSKGRLFLTQHAPDRDSRKKLFRQFASSGYSAVCLMCTGESVMTKWKWATAIQVPASVLIVNENADYFWLTRSNWRMARAIVKHRVGLHGLGPLRLVEQAIVFPFTVLLLAGFAARVHARRILRTL